MVTRDPNGQQKATQLNLRRLFPVSPLNDVRVTLGWLSLAIFGSMAAGIVNFHPAMMITAPSLDIFLKRSVPVVAIILCGIWLTHYIYTTLRRLTLYYGIEDGHLVMSQGIVIKKCGFFPLARITDVYLERSLLDFIFGLQTLHISTPTLLSEQFARIDGLSTQMAVNLQHALAAVIENSHHQNRSPKKQSNRNKKSQNEPPVSDRTELSIMLAEPNCYNDFIEPEFKLAGGMR